MTPQMATIVERISQFRAALALNAMGSEDESGAVIDWDDFCIILSGVPSFRRLPGIPEHAGFEPEYKCASDEDKEELRQYLESSFGITDLDSLETQSHEFYHYFNEYCDFVFEWGGQPGFTMDEIGERGAAAYTASRDFAAQLRDLVQERGFLAWDIGERVMLARAAYACDLISQGDFYRRIREEGRLAAEFFTNFVDYAISVLTGCVYFMFVNMDRREEGGILEFLDINMKIVSTLFQNGIWPLDAWCDGSTKPLAIREDQVQQLLTPEFDGMTAVASDRILCDGFRIAVMIREKPISETDTGWRFFAGDESPEYIRNSKNFGELDLNIIMNYSPEAIAHLSAPIGAFIARNENGDFEAIDRSLFLKKSTDES